MRLTLIVVCGLLVTRVASLDAQTQMVGVAGGVSQYDLSGTGTEPFGAVRYGFTPARASAVVLEGNLQYFRYRQQFGERRHHIFSEVMVQLQLPRGAFRPYLGAGAGFSFANGSGDQADFTVAGAGGIRLVTQSRWIFGAELRVRAVDPWVGTTADWGLSIARGF